LLNELCTQILELGLFQEIKQDEGVITKVKDLPYRLTKSFLEPKFVQFAIELEPILDQIMVDLHMQRDGQVNLEDHIKHKNTL